MHYYTSVFIAYFCHESLKHMWSNKTLSQKPMKTSMCHFLLHLFGFDLNFNTDEHQKISFATSTFQAFFGPSSRFNSSTVNMKSDLPVRFSVVSNRNVDRQMISRL